MIMMMVIVIIVIGGINCHHNEFFTPVMHQNRRPLGLGLCSRPYTAWGAFPYPLAGFRGLLGDSRKIRNEREKGERIKEKMEGKEEYLVTGDRADRRPCSHCVRMSACLPVPVFVCLCLCDCMYVCIRGVTLSTATFNLVTPTVSGQLMNPTLKYGRLLFYLINLHTTK